MAMARVKRLRTKQRAQAECSIKGYSVPGDLADCSVGQGDKHDMWHDLIDKLGFLDRAIEKLNTWS